MQDLVYTTDWLSDSTVFKVNTIDPHSDHHYYRNEAELKQHASSFVQSLNGNWKVSYVKDSNLRARDFYKQGFNESGFDSIKVPGHLELQGFGKPQYVNTQYPWDGSEFLRPDSIPQNHNAVASYIRHFTVNEGLKTSAPSFRSKVPQRRFTFGSTVISSATVKTPSRPTSLKSPISCRTATISLRSNYGSFLLPTGSKIRISGVFPACSAMLSSLRFQAPTSKTSMPRQL